MSMWRGSIVLCLLLVPAVLCQNRPDGGQPPDERPEEGQCRDTCDGDEDCGGTASCYDGQCCMVRDATVTPDLSVCSGVDGILQGVLSNINCLSTFSEAFAANKFSGYCSNFVIGAQCVAKQLVGQMYARECLAEMLAYLEASPEEMFKALKAYGILYNEDFTSRTLECFDDVDEPEDGDWNTQCPDMEDEDTEFCPNQCPADKKCGKNGDVCCPVNGQDCTLCIPDMRNCANISRIATQMDRCKSYRKSIFTSETNEEFCSSFWEAMECVSENIATKAYHQMCLKRMAMAMRRGPQRILEAVATHANIELTDKIRRFAGKAIGCKESPVYVPPNRPTPEVVNDCSDVKKIMTHGRSCTQISSPSNSNKACSQLKAFITCVVSKLYPDEESNSIKKKQCAGEIMEVIRENRQRLKTEFPGLAEADVDGCEEKESVCGDSDVKPLDRVDCSRTRCPANYDCKNGYCCPTQKMGECPKTKGTPLCKAKCSKDLECGDNQKCCNIGCGARTCVEMVSSQLSPCQTQRKDARQLVEKAGICGDGTTVLNVAHCVNQAYNPIQGDFQNGLLYCVYVNGTKIPGSDFTGNRDCTKVRPGVCPAQPSVCDNGAVINSCNNDDKCEPGQKCCNTQVSNVCVRKCVTANEAPKEVPDDCMNRQCCPFSICQDRECPKDRTAVCRINSCGGCTVEFYNAAGKIVNCSDGISKCQNERTQAAHRNNQRNKQSDEEKVMTYFDASDRDRDDDNDRMDRTMDGGDDDDDDDDDDGEDEYGEKRLSEDEIPDDGRTDSDHGMERSKSMMVMMRMCYVVEKYGLCKNEATCSVGQGESMWELCKCKEGTHGLLCDKQGTVQPMDSQCNRDRARLEDMKALMSNSSEVQMMLQDIASILKPKLIPVIECDAAGNYYPVLAATTLPEGKNSIEIYVCVNTATGERLVNTPVTLTSTNQYPDCDNTNDEYPDILEMSKKCIMSSPVPCANGPCDYYWNQTSATCEAGEAGKGFYSLPQCYDSCAVKAVCDATARMEDSRCEPEFGVGPKPCMTLECNYHRQFCNVTDEDGPQVGSCQDFPSHCLLPADPGFKSDTRHRCIGAYYYNATNRRCEKFTYCGEGGNKNRFYHLDQCHTECSTRKYKYADAVCPIPEVLMRVGTAPQCNEDMDCLDDQVCCSNTRQRVCTKPLRSCSTGERCSMYGACEGGKCICPSVCPEVLSPVCGSDGKTYNNECHLQQHACKTLKPLSKRSDGACPTVACGEKQCKHYELCNGGQCVCPEACIALYEPVCGVGQKTGILRTFGNECEMTVASCNGMEEYVKSKDHNGACDPEGGEQCIYPCTKEYRPLCALDDSVSPSKLTTYGNKCMMTKAMLCEDKKLKVLYPGECQRECGKATCAVYQECIDEECKCRSACTKEYDPVCAYPTGNPTQLETFSNPCLLRNHSCVEEKIYVILKHGPCIEPKQEAKCPETKHNITGSAVFLCNPDTNSFCADTEMCCPYGAGTRCIPYKRLIKEATEKPGVCPMMSYINTDRSECNKCKDDSGCAGTAKCCPNSVCGVSVCAVPNNIIKSSLCQSLEMVGITCMNGGKCSANLTSGQICQCAPGYYGPFCESTTIHNCQIQTNCLESPCSVNTCEAFPSATCQDNYCEGCNAVYTDNNVDVTAMCKDKLCLRQQALYEKMTSYLQGLRESDDTEGPESMEEMMDMDILMKKLMTMLAKFPNFRGFPVDGVKCSSTGDFEPVQCVFNMERQTDVCYCVNTTTGMPLRHTGHATSAESLDCSVYTVRNGKDNDFCMETPDMDSTCGNSEAQRFYFNPTTNDCEGFMDTGCNGENKNSFNSYETCNATCVAQQTTSSPCAVVRCGFETRCRVIDGTAKCVGKTDIGEFEPVCEKDGKYLPKQCNGDVCKCVNPANGEEVPDSVTMGTELECVVVGDKVEARKSRESNCENGSKRVFCKHGGDSCKNCTMPEGRNAGEGKETGGQTGKEGGRNEDGKQMEGSTSSIKEDGTCSTCKTCPASSKRKICDAACKQTTCKSFPSAICEINKCTCKEEFKAGDKVINCNKVYSQCEREKHVAETQQRSQRMRNKEESEESEASEATVITCTEDKVYERQCKGDKCRCLNATSGLPVGDEKSKNQLDCKQVQSQTKPENVKMRAKLSDRSMKSFSSVVLTKLKTKVKELVEKFGVKVIVANFFEGSTMVDVDMACTVSCESDVYSVASTLTAKMNKGDFVVEADGETFTASEATITETLTSEQLNGPATEPVPKDDDNNTTIIIVVVVIVVVAIIAVAMAVYCYKKANKQKNTGDLQFHDLRGQENPTYKS